MKNRISVSSLDEIGSILESNKLSGKAAIISDSNVYNLYYERCRQSLMAAGFKVEGYRFTAGEKSKNIDTYAEILEFLSEKRLSRSDTVIAIGGGVTGDLAGFAAATYLRGIRLCQVPTSLLSMVDSSIGGKTGINLRMGKNLAGTFYLPDIILHDISLLNTLPSREWHNGHAELIKMGIISGMDLFSDVSSESSLEDQNKLSTIIYRSSELKRIISDDDFLDHGKRHILNLGHTVGHAIEKLSNYEISHGEAVCKGISVVSKISELLNCCSTETRTKIDEVLLACNFNLDIEFTTKQISDAVKNDKKVMGDKISIVLIEEIGKCIVHDISLKEFDKILGEALKGVA